MATSVCLLQMENEKVNFRLFAANSANGNGKRKFVFLGRQNDQWYSTIAVSANVPSMDF
jgi:hypothetical protein